MSSPDPPAPDPLDALRARVLRFALNVLAIAMPMISGFLIVAAFDRGVLTARTLLLSSSGLLFPTLWLVRRRLDYRGTVGVLVALLAFTGFLLASRGVLTVGYGAVVTMTVLSGALFFGRRGAVISIAAVLGLHFTAFGLVIGGIVPPPDPGMWDPRIPAVWLRHGVILAMLGIIVAAMELYVVEQLAHQVDVHRELAGHEMRQRQSLEQAEREREHERAQREHAQHALEQARRLEALGRISGGIAHDFNNALTVIMGTADVARLSVPPDGEVAHYLGEIIEASRRAADLTSQLMTLGRQHVASKRPVDMHPFLTHLQGALRRVLPDDITLVVDLPPTRLIAHADAAGLERALYNLVLNARDAMPRGGSIVVSCLAETVAGGTGPIADGTYVTLRIADTGHGMSAETLECIFDPFFTTKGDRGGTGLGLATVYAFATEARGEIDATSEPGVGTTFTLRLPISAEPESAGVVDSGTAAATAAARRQGRVLVVEDRDDVRLNIVRTLRVRGFEVQEAPDGDAAVDTLTAAPGFDLMCIDGVMPGLGTAEVIERARHLAPTMRVLLCSGHVREELLRRGVEAGRYAFLAKPFTSEELLDGVDAALRTPAPNVSPFPG